MRRARVREEALAESVQPMMVAIARIEERRVRAAKPSETAQARKEDRALCVMMSEEEAPRREGVGDKRVRGVGRGGTDVVERSRERTMDLHEALVMSDMEIDGLCACGRVCGLHASSICMRTGAVSADRARDQAERARHRAGVVPKRRANARAKRLGSPNPCSSAISRTERRVVRRRSAA